jgi:hypothetical protein
MKTIIRLTLLVFLLAILTGCRKGANPPFDAMVQVSTNLVEDCRSLAEAGMGQGKEIWTQSDPLPASIKALAPQYVRLCATPESTVVDIQLSGGFQHRGLLVVCSSKDIAFAPVKGRNWRIMKLRKDVYEYRE